MMFILWLLIGAALALSLRRARADADPDADAGSVLDREECLRDLQDTSAVARVMRKAARGEDVTIALIGGSITMGTVSVGADDARYPARESYSAYFFRWWREQFPETHFQFINAGIGGTDSYLGVHRVERDVLCHRPDLVLIEFSVNDDARADMTPLSYHSLVRRVLECESRPAVMLLFMAQSSGETAANVHRRIGEAYRLPMVSIDKVFARLIGRGTAAKALSGDVVHPSAYGHAVVGALLRRCLDMIRESGQRESLPRAECPIPDLYQKPALLCGSDRFDFDPGSFMPGSGSDFYPHGWTHEKAGGPFACRLTFRRLGILWLRTIDGTCGQCKVSVDGEEAAELDGDFPNGWGNAITAQEVYAGDEAKEHTASLSVPPQEKERWILLGFLVSV